MSCFIHYVFSLLPLLDIQWSVTPQFHQILSAVLWLRHASGADRFHSSLCVNFHLVCCAAYLLCPSSGSLKPSGTDMQDCQFWRMPEHDVAIQLNLAPSGQEVTHRKQKYSIRSLFKIKHPMLIQAHQSQKRDKYKLFY